MIERKSKKTHKKRRGAAYQRRIAAGKANLLKFRKNPRTAAVTHGIRALIRSNGAVMPPVPHADEIRERVDGIIAEAVQDLGGESELTAQKRVILRSERLALLVLELAGALLAREGLLNRKTGKPHAVLSIAATYANSARLSAIALGLERRARKVGPANLAEYLESREKVEPESEAEAPLETEAEAIPETEAQE